MICEQNHSSRVVRLDFLGCIGTTSAFGFSLALVSSATAIDHAIGNGSPVSLASVAARRASHARSDSLNILSMHPVYIRTHTVAQGTANVNARPRNCIFRRVARLKHALLMRGWSIYDIQELADLVRRRGNGARATKRTGAFRWPRVSLNSASHSGRQTPIAARLGSISGCSLRSGCSRRFARPGIKAAMCS